MLSHFSCVWFFVILWTVACQAPLSMGFSRQESWSRLPCPPPKVKVTQSCQTLCDPMDYAVHGILQASILEWVAFPFFRWSSQPRDQTQVSCLAGGFFTNWAIRRIFPTQGSNPGLLPCRQILYHLSYQGSLLNRRLRKQKGETSPLSPRIPGKCELLPG